MRIRTAQDAEAARDLIGDQNVEACGRALADGARVWFFQTEKEIENDSELTEQEKRECKKILQEEGLGYAGWVRPPKREPTREQIMLGAVASSCYDSHGNYRGGGGGGHESIH
jgi:hypothetical protein